MSPTFVYVLGPTASGKSQLALQLAENLNWPILNCDSVQVFTETLIGTAQPTEAEIKRVPHYLFDYVAPPINPTVADYLQDVVKVLKTQAIANALFVGGSGFYVQALEKGLYPESQVSAQVEKEVEQLWQEWGAERIFSWIQERDPEFARKISANDHYRVRRAFAVMKSQKLNMTELKKLLQKENHSLLPQHRAIKVGLNDSRENLRTRVEARTDAMLQAGFVQEVQELRAKGWGQWAPMQSVGYKEVQAHLDGEISRAELPARIVTATMQLIKKQQTWFKRDPSIQWFRPEQSKEAQEWVLQQVSLATPLSGSLD